MKAHDGLVLLADQKGINQMAKDWVEIFKQWSKPPTEQEEEKGAKAAQMINDALREYEPLKQRNFDVYATGSYRNNTNVREGSDIDIGIVSQDSFFYKLPEAGIPTKEMAGIIDAKYGLVEFRNDVREALKKKFGDSGFKETDKTFNIHETRRRLDADATVFCDHRHYTGEQLPNGSWKYLLGVETRPKSEPSKRIINWHQQHYDEGVKRNDPTKRRFKRITRILKRLRDDMKESGSSSAKAAAERASSFLLECLVFNAPDKCFNLEEGSYYKDTQAVIQYLWENTRDDNGCKDWPEVSRLKDLFSSAQAWTRDDANRFMVEAWNHVGFKG